MKKTTFLLALIALCSTFALISCGNDDEASPGSSSSSKETFEVVFDPDNLGYLKGNGLQFMLTSDKTAALTGYYNSAQDKVTIPYYIKFNGLKYTVTEISKSALYSHRMSSVKIPNSVTTIGDYSFSHCESLTSVEIPNSVTSIGFESFRYCFRLAEIISLNTTPPSVGYYCFYNVNDHCVLRVPDKSIDAYKAARGWKDFNNICGLKGGNADAEKGTIGNPYTASEAVAFASSLEADVKSAPVFVRGIVSRINEVSPTYGNATFYISDDGTTANEFYIYRCKGLGNKDITSEDAVKIDDKVIIYGPLVNYRGNTPESVVDEAYIYSINGTK